MEEANNSKNDEKCMELGQKMQEALYHKDMGNECFKKLQYDKAIKFYSHGIECDKYNVLLPANRAMAYIKLDKYVEAEDDCTTAILLDPMYVKAYHRRGLSRLKTKRYNEARLDFLKVLELEPGNKQALKELETLDKNQKKVDKGPVGISHCDGRAGNITKMRNDKKSCFRKADDKYIKCIEKLPHLRSKKPLKRLMVEEIENDDTRRDLATATNSSDVNISNSIQKCQQLTVDQDADVVKSVKFSNECDEIMGRDKVRDDGIVETECKPPIPASSVGENLTGEVNLDNFTKCDAEVCRDRSNVEISFCQPKTCYQFEASWRKFNRNKNLKVDYLKNIDSSILPSLFTQGFESDTFCDIVNFLIDPRNFGPGEDPLMILHHISLTGRFNALVMFLSDSYKRGIKSLLANVDYRSSHSEDFITELRKSYCL